MKNNAKKYRWNLIISIVVFAAIIIVLAVFHEPGKTDSDSSEGKLREYSDLDSSKYVIGCPTGTLDDYVVKENFPNARLAYGNSMEVMPVMLESRMIDAYLTRIITLPYVFENHPELTFFPDTVYSLSPAFFSSNDSKGHDLVDKFDKFYDDLCEKGEYSKIREKWESYSEDDKTKVMPDLNFTGENGVLNVAVSMANYPYDYLDGKEEKGLYLELVERFCAENGYIPKYYTVELSAAVIGVQSGKYDLYAGDVSASSELKESVAFTKDFEVSEEVAVVRKSSVAPDVLKNNESRMEEAYITRIRQSDSFGQAVWNSVNKTLIREQRWKMLAKGLLITIALSVCSALLGTAAGICICYLIRQKSAVLNKIGNAYIVLFERIPVLVLLLLTNYLVLGKINLPPFWICVISFALNYAAFMADMTGRGIESIPKGQFLAAISLGYGKARAFKKIILPQVIYRVFPEYRMQLVTLVNTTALAGYISVQDITKVAEIIKSRTFEEIFPLVLTAAIYFLMAGLLVAGLKLIVRRVDPKFRRTLPKGARP